MSIKDMLYPENKNFSNAEEKAFAREDLIYNVTEDLLVLLEDNDLSKKDLARKLGKSQAYVSQTLSGARNMTLGTLSDICYVLGVTPSINVGLEDDSEDYSHQSEEASQRFSVSAHTKKDHVWEDSSLSAQQSSVGRRTSNVIKRDIPQWNKQAA